MGAIISAPITALASCLGGCTAVACCKVLECGTLSSARAARISLLWLQVFAAALAVAASSVDPGRWLRKACAHLDGVGVCQCEHSAQQDTCYVNQLTYRIQGAAVVVFAILFLLSCSGCAHGAARSYVVLKFAAVLLISVAFLFVPTSFFSGFGEVASATSALFLVAQTVLVISLAYTWNECWYSKALEAQRGRPGTRGTQTWQCMILSSAAALIVAALVGAVAMFVALPGPTTHAVLIPVLVVAFALLLLSITSWCEHGALLTSAACLAYFVWLAFEALALAPRSQLAPQTWLRVLELVVCAATLAALAGSAGLGRAMRASGAPAAATDESHLEAGEGPAQAAAQAAPETEAGWVFAAHCAVHAAAALYVCSALAPAASAATFALRAAALALALALYFWSLVAPKILTSRTFA